jgi:hypothetical protein
MMTMLALILLLAAPDAAPKTPILPQASDIGSALAARWVMISSTGMSLHDYVVRDARCVSVTLDPKYNEPEKDSPIGIMADKVVSQVRCRYEYATMDANKPRYSVEPIIKPKQKQFSQAEIDRIPEKRWRQEERDFVRMSVTRCRYMGRIPQEGECDDYWLVER